MFEKILQYEREDENEMKIIIDLVEEVRVRANKVV